MKPAAPVTSTFTAWSVASHAIAARTRHLRATRPRRRGSSGPRPRGEDLARAETREDERPAARHPPVLVGSVWIWPGTSSSTPADDLEDLVGVALELRGSDPGDVGQVSPVLNVAVGDLSEGSIMKDDVGRDAVRLRSLATPFLQTLQDRSVGDRRDRGVASQPGRDHLRA